MKAFFSGRNLFSSIVSITLSVAFVATVAFASSTISSNIQTDGTLSVSGVTTFVGQMQASSTALFGVGVTIGTGTVANSLDGTILFKSQASDPTGVTQGTFYYNSTSKVLKMYDGTAWFTVGTTTSGISLTGARLQLGDLTLNYLTLGTSTPVAGGSAAVVTIQATSTVSVPLILVGTLGQTGNLFSIRDNTNARLLYVTAAGNLFATGTLQVSGAVTAYGNLSVTGNLGTSSSTPIQFGGNITVPSGFGLDTAIAGQLNIGTTTANAVSIGASTATTTINGLLTSIGRFNVNGMATTSATTGSFGTLGNIGAGTTTPTTLELSAQGAATTTIGAFSSGTRVGGCIQLQATNGALYRMYVANDDIATTTSNNGHTGIIAVWQAGGCK